MSCPQPQEGKLTISITSMGSREELAYNNGGVPSSNSTYCHHELLMPTRSKRFVKVLLRATSSLTLLTDRYISAEVYIRKGPSMLPLY